MEVGDFVQWDISKSDSTVPDDSTAYAYGVVIRVTEKMAFAKELGAYSIWGHSTGGRGRIKRLSHKRFEPARRIPSNARRLGEKWLEEQK